MSIQVVSLALLGDLDVHNEIRSQTSKIIVPIPIRRAPPTFMASCAH